MRRMLRRQMNLLREFSIPLIGGVMLALLWANLDPVGYHHFDSTPIFGGLSFHFISNDIFMTLFFGIAAVEITQSCLPGGELNPFSKAMNPLLATMGGVLGPALTYTVLNVLFGTPELAHGWGIPTATDIALAWLAARMVFGSDHPAVSFLLLLAVADDAIGLAIIALFYPDPLQPVVPLWLFLTATGMAFAYGLRRLTVRSYWPYLIIGGGLSWAGLYLAHLHPALALIFIVPFLPHPKRDPKQLFEENPADYSTLSLFEREWKVVVDIGLFIFGLANAGVEFSRVGTVTWLVLAALLVGKTAGIFAFGCLAGILGFRLPNGVRKRDLLIIGVISGTGFTVALFVTEQAFVDHTVMEAAKMGAMFSIVAAFFGMMLGRLLGVRKCVR
jgi:NhaA family Na+:H+ antiporter